MEKIHDIDKLNNWAQEAQDVVWGDREADYDHPIRDFIGTAMNLTSYLRRKLAVGEVIGVLDVPMFMVAGFKPSRESHKMKKDNMVDTIGYSLTKQRVQEWLNKYNLEHTDLMGIYTQLQVEWQAERFNKYCENLGGKV